MSSPLSSPGLFSSSLLQAHDRNFQLFIKKFHRTVIRHALLPCKFWKFVSLNSYTPLYLNLFYALLSYFNVFFFTFLKNLKAEQLFEIKKCLKNVKFKIKIKFKTSLVFHTILSNYISKHVNDLSTTLCLLDKFMGIQDISGKMIACVFIFISL